MPRPYAPGPPKRFRGRWGPSTPPVEPQPRPVPREDQSTKPDDKEKDGDS